MSNRVRIIFLSYIRGLRHGTICSYLPSYYYDFDYKRISYTFGFDESPSEDKLFRDYYSKDNLHRIPFNYKKVFRSKKLSIPVNLARATKIVSNCVVVLLKKWLPCFERFFIKLIVSIKSNKCSLYLINSTMSIIDYILSLIMKHLLYYRRYYNIVYRLFLFSAAL